MTDTGHTKTLPLSRLHETAHFNRVYTKRKQWCAFFIQTGPSFHGPVIAIVMPGP